MRVAHIITRLVIGGAQENTIATILGLRGKPDLDLKLISGPAVGPEGSLESAAKSVPDLLTMVPELVRPVHPWKDIFAYGKLVQILRALRPDLVHTHSGKAGILGRLAARKAGVPIVIHHIHGPSFGPWQGKISNLVFKGAERVAGRVTDHFFCSANAMSQLYLSAGIGHPGQYTRIFSGFDVTPFLQAGPSGALRERLGLQADDFVVGKLGRLAPLKGHSDLIDAAPAIIQECSRARFLIVGDGRLRSRLECQVRASGLADRFVFTGLVAPAEVPDYLAVMDCLVHLSYREALSRALPQALAAGIPVVSYDFDGADEVCRDGETGFVVHQGDTQAVAHRVVCLAKDSALRKEMGERGQALVREAFNIERMVQSQYEVYKRLANARGIK